MTDLRSAARALGGEVVGRGIVCPGPHHSREDRSLSILFDASAPGGFTLHSHAGDDFGICRDYVRERLGLQSVHKVDTFNSPAGGRNRAPAHGSELGGAAQIVPAPEQGEGGGETPAPSPTDRTALALRIWREAQPAEGSPVEAYLASRGLKTLYNVQDCLRFHPACPFAGTRTPAMVALVRNVVTNEPQAIHRSALMSDGRKAVVNGQDRLALGSIRGGAVKLSPDEEVTYCIGIGEGIESTLSLRGLPEFGERTPVWALLNTAGVSGFMPLQGIESLWLAVDHDPAGEKAAATCAGRWRFAGKEVFLVKAKEPGADLNDIAREVRHG